MRNLLSAAAVLLLLMFAATLVPCQERSADSWYPNGFQDRTGYSPVASFGNPREFVIAGAETGAETGRDVAVDLVGPSSTKRIWTLAGNRSDEVRSMLPLGEHLVLLGSTSSTEGLIAIGAEAMLASYIVRLDRTGEMVWSTMLSSAALTEPWSFDVDLETGLIVVACGSSEGRGTNLFGNKDIVLFGLDLDGNILWNRNLGTLEDDVAAAVDISVEGVAVVFSSWSGENGWDMNVVTLGTDGSVHSESVLGSSGQEIPSAVRWTNDGDLIITGAFTGSGFAGQSYGQTDLFFCRLDPDQGLVWTAHEGGASTELAGALFEQPSGQFALVWQTDSHYGTVVQRFGGIDVGVSFFDIDGNTWSHYVLGTADNEYPVGLLDSQDYVAVVAAVSRGTQEMLPVVLTVAVTGGR